jgi:hypothetical protein
MLAGGVSMKLRATGGSSVALFLFLGIHKSKTGGSRPARRLTFVQTATKVSKNAFLLAEGIFFCRTPVISFSKRGWEPARYRGPHVIAFMSG